MLPMNTYHPYFRLDVSMEQWRAHLVLFEHWHNVQDSRYWAGGQNPWAPEEPQRDLSPTSPTAYWEGLT